MEDNALAHRAVSPDNGAKPVADDSSSSESSGNNELVIVGGEIPTPAFALLDGVAYGKNLDPSDCTKISVAITRIPATLGRSHDNSDPDFFSLGHQKAISREQCRIHFLEPNGGNFVVKDDGTFVYEPHKGKKREIIPLHEGEPLPSHGFFAIEVLGKNRITVGKKRVEQGQVAQLENGTPIRMSTVCLFFLLPTDAVEQTMEIPAKSKRKPASAKAGREPSAKRQSTGSGGGPQGALLQELEAMSTDDLLEEIRDAIASDTWERRQQLVGGMLAFQAVKDASRSKRIRQVVRDTGGVHRKDIMDWMAKSSKYGFWVAHTLNRNELTSYQTLITRTLQKAGYERLGKHGRYVRWKLPPSADVESEVSDEKLESDEDESEEQSESEPSDDDNEKKMSATNKEEENSSSDDANKEEEKSSSDDEDDGGEGGMNEDDDSSLDDNEESSAKPSSVIKQDPNSGDDGDSDDDNMDSSNEEEELTSKANQRVEEVA